LARYNLIYNLTYNCFSWTPRRGGKHRSGKKKIFFFDRLSEKYHHHLIYAKKLPQAITPSIIALKIPQAT